MSAAWRRLAVSMAVAAAYDLAFAVAMVFFPVPASRLLSLPPPQDPTYLGLSGLLIAVLAGMYALAASDAIRYQGIVRVAIAGRSLGAIYLGCAAWSHDLAGAFVATAAADLGFALAHAVLLAAARRSDATQVPEDARS